jgi:hypothetical protein
MAYGSFDHDLGDWKWKVIFGTSIIKVSKIHANMNLAIPFFTSTIFEIHVGYLTS